MIVTVAELIERAQGAAGMEDDGDGLVSPTEWANYATVENRALTNLVTRRGVILSQGRYVVTADGSAEYQLTTPTTIDPLAIVGLYHYSAGRFRRIPRAEALDTSVRDLIDVGDATRYQLNRVGGSASNWTLTLHPIPASGTYHLYYVPAPPKLVTGTPAAGEDDEVNLPSGWEEWIVLRMARRALLKEETQPSTLMDLIAEVEETIVDQANGMVLGEGVRFRNRDAWESPWQSSPRCSDYLRDWQFV